MVSEAHSVLTLLLPSLGDSLGLVLILMEWLSIRGRRSALYAPENHFTGPWVAVLPVETLFDHLVVRRDVSGVEDGMTFVVLRRSPKSEHRISRGFEREEVIVSAVDHQKGHSDSASPT